MDFHMAFGGNMAMDINTDPNCGWTMDPVWPLVAARTWTSPWSQEAAKATYNNVVLGYHRIASGVDGDQGYSYGLLGTET